MEKSRIAGQYVLKGKIEALSPLHVGCGSRDRTDMDVIRDENGAPFVPASSFLGALRGAIIPRSENCKGDLEKFWGFIRGEDGLQSAVRCSDLACRDGGNGRRPQVVARDGVRIDNKTGMALDKGKYDYEILEHGATFSLEMEFDFQKETRTFVEKMIATILDLLSSGAFRLGAKTNSGLGSVRLLEKDRSLYLFDFEKKADVFQWLSRRRPDENRLKVSRLGPPMDIRPESFFIEARLRLKNSLIVRSYPDDPKGADAVQLKSAGENVLSDTSLKGAIRARAERIAKTLGIGDFIVTDIFGNVEDKNRSKNAKKGRIRVGEVVLPGFVSELQTRIKIDRFTGGTIEAALFDTMPLYARPDDKILHVCLDLRDRPETRSGIEAQAGLLLLVLKDLWTGDLAVGGEKNIGRGVFEGVSFDIVRDGNPVFVHKTFDALAPLEKETLQSYVNALLSENPS